MNLNQMKAAAVAAGSVLSSVLGTLYIPIILMVLCNVIDYATGLMAAPSRKEGISSYRGMRGICKKVSMWLLVVVGAIIDQLLRYATDTFGIALPFSFLVACIVAVWIICNELISILENMVDIGVEIPVFLMPLVRHIRNQMDEAAESVMENAGNVTKNEESGEEP